eukprot:241533_1
MCCGVLIDFCVFFFSFIVLHSPFDIRIIFVLYFLLFIEFTYYCFSDVSIDSEILMYVISESNMNKADTELLCFTMFYIEIDSTSDFLNDQLLKKIIIFSLTDFFNCVQLTKKKKKKITSFKAVPSAYHMALVALAKAGILKHLVSQNTNGIHR